MHDGTIDNHLEVLLPVCPDDLSTLPCAAARQCCPITSIDVNSSPPLSRLYFDFRENSASHTHHLLMGGRGESEEGREGRERKEIERKGTERKGTERKK